MLEFRRLGVFSDVLVVRPQRFSDNRGYFTETYNAKAFVEAGITDVFVQDNYSLSLKAGTLRGMHYQTPPHGQAKLVRCVSGRLLDVVVDIRPDSKTFGRHETITICAERGEQLYIPVGYAHGFCTLVDNTGIAYKTSAFYSVDHDAGIIYDDKTLGIDWPFSEETLVLSEKDRALPEFVEASLDRTNHSANGAS